MFVRPSRRAYGLVDDEAAGRKRKRREGDTEHLLLINEMNNYYRMREGSWYAYYDENGKKMWPIVITRMLTPGRRPDIVELGGALMYNGKYLDDHCCDGYTQARAPPLPLAPRSRHVRGFTPAFVRVARAAATAPGAAQGQRLVHLEHPHQHRFVEDLVDVERRARVLL